MVRNEIEIILRQDMNCFISSSALLSFQGSFSLHEDILFALREMHLKR